MVKLTPYGPAGAYLIQLLNIFALLIPGIEVNAIAFHNRVDPLQWQRHRRFYPPRVPDALTGHGMRYIQKPHVNPVSVRQPHLNYDRMTHVGIHRQQNVAEHLGGFLQPEHPAPYLPEEPPAGWGLLRSAISRRFDDFLDQSGLSRTLFFSSVGSWYNAFESTLKRDAIYNIGKVGGILILYYFFPGVLTWISSTFGAV